MNILQLSAVEVLEKYRDSTLSPVDVMSAVLKQVKDINPKLNAFVLIDTKESLLEQAKASEKRWGIGKPIGKLDGIPTTIKDGYDVIGWATRHGSLLSSTDILEEDSPSVAMLRDAGAIFIGKTTLPENGCRGVTESLLQGITRNPWNSSKTSGGSSGGAAVAAATGMGFLHLGGDAGGSLRIPASFCGVYGVKPTPKQIPKGTPDMFSSFSSVGSVTRYVEDSILMLDVMMGASIDIPQKLKIAFATTINETPVETEISQQVNNIKKHLKLFGSIEEIEINIDSLVETFNTHWIAAAKMKLEETPIEDHKKLDNYLQEWGCRDVTLSSYIKAEIDRMIITEQMEKLLNEYDILVLPTMAIAAFDVDCNSPTLSDGTIWEDWTPFTFPANLAGLPAASLPCGMTSGGLPVGVQIISSASQDNLVLSVSYELEKQLNFKKWS